MTGAERLDVFEDVPPEGRAEAPESEQGAVPGLVPVQWDKLWSDEAPVQDWCIEPLIPSGRAVALYAPAKVGKSLLALDMVAAAASGRSILGQPDHVPISIVYLDMEMTPADLRERLSDLGYGPETDLSRLAYYQLPTLPALDTAEGGEALQELVTKHKPKLLVIDTMARAVEGEENRADTYRSYYRRTGQRLKEAGVAVLRLDHEGKDRGSGQRGSSAKVDDVDVVFRLTAVGNKRFELARTHSRVPWVPHKVSLERHQDPTLRHVIVTNAWPAGTGELAMQLNELGVPLDATYEFANKLLRGKSERGRQKALVLAALRYRRTPLE